MLHASCTAHPWHDGSLHTVHPFRTVTTCLLLLSLSQTFFWLAGMVDQYINAHAGTQNLFDIGKSDGKLKVGLL